MNDILAYLQAIDKMAANLKAPTIEGIVLKHGKAFPAPNVARPKNIKKGKDRECYRNSFLVAELTNWQYVEGFAIASNVPFPLQHAWVVDPEGNVVETTWDAAGMEYFGIPLDLDFARVVLLETRTYGILDYRSPTFRKKFINH